MAKRSQRQDTEPQYDSEEERAAAAARFSATEEDDVIFEHAGEAEAYNVPTGEELMAQALGIELDEDGGLIEDDGAASPNDRGEGLVIDGEETA